MSENYMESIAKLLGVRLGEKFIVTHKGERYSELYYCLTKYGLSVIGTDFYDNSILISLLTGFYKIKKFLGNQNIKNGTIHSHLLMVK